MKITIMKMQIVVNQKSASAPAAVATALAVVIHIGDRRRQFVQLVQVLFEQADAQPFQVVLLGGGVGDHIVSKPAVGVSGFFLAGRFLMGRAPVRVGDVIGSMWVR